MSKRDVRICPVCDQENASDSRFCYFCGSLLVSPGTDDKPGYDDKTGSPYTGGRPYGGPAEPYPGGVPAADEDEVGIEGDSVVWKPAGTGGTGTGGTGTGKGSSYAVAILFFLLVGVISFFAFKKLPGLSGPSGPAADDPAAWREEAQDEDPVEDYPAADEEEDDFRQEETYATDERGLKDTFIAYGHEYRIYDMSYYGIEDLDDPGADDDYIGYQALQDFCAERNGYLAVISDEEENSIIYQHVRDLGEKSAFFGYTDWEYEGYWYWEDNDTSTYTNWNRASGQPNNGYVNGKQQADFGEDFAQFYQNADDGTWNDSAFGINTRLFVFERVLD